jgi:cytochrome c peroxidase
MRLRQGRSARRAGVSPDRRRRAAIICALLAAWGVLQAPASIGSHDPASIPQGDEPITPVPRTVALDADKVRLGEMLFHDERLSHGDNLACASCHRLAEGGDDNQALSPGADGELLDFNAPTVFNAALSFRLNWRGNFRTLEGQIEAVLLDPRLMNTTWEELLAKLRTDAVYREAFLAVYGSAATPADVLDALATFERSLLTPDARFDRYLRGEHEALEANEEHGYALFKAYGCVACHQGVNVGGNLFQKFGIFYNPFSQHGAVTEADLGRLAITSKEADRHVFRVPSLRNVGLTAPYFHNGTAASLEEAVDAMARSQLGRSLTEEEIASIVAFLHTLTGEYQGRPLVPGSTRSP